MACNSDLLPRYRLETSLGGPSLPLPAPHWRSEVGGCGVLLHPLVDALKTSDLLQAFQESRRVAVRRPCQKNIFHRFADADSDQHAKHGRIYERVEK